MTKQKTTKKTLLASVLSLMLCCVMLIGTTFAWFTDSVTSGNNKIVSGNLNVELEYSTDMSNWKPVTSTTNIFKEGALWEPGYTEVVYLRVSNLGSLALKYQLGIDIISETEGVNKAGETFKLSDYIEFGVIDPVSAKFEKRSDARKAVTDAKKISAGYAKESSIMAEGAPNVLALVVYMPETVGDDANYGTTQPMITLGLDLVATQVEAEYDSFGQDYDAEAVFEWDGSVDTSWYNDEATSFDLEDGAQLAGLAQLVNGGNTFAGKTIALTSAVDLADVAWTPIAQGDTVFKGIFDGNGHTISNLSISSVKEVASEDGYAGLFGKTADATIKNVKLNNVTISTEMDAGEFTVIGAVVGQAYTGTVTNCYVSNLNITDAAESKYIGGITGHGYAKIADCYVQGIISPDSAAQLGGIIGMQASGYIENCYVDAEISGGYTIAGGIVGFGNGTEGSLGVKNCYFTGKIEHHKPYYGEGSNVAGIVAYGWGPLASWNSADPYYTVENCYVDAEFVNTDGTPATNPQYIVAACAGDYGTSEMFEVVDCSWNGTDSYTWYGYENAENGYVYGTATKSDNCTYTSGMSYAEFVVANK